MESGCGETRDIETRWRRHISMLAFTCAGEESGEGESRSVVGKTRKHSRMPTATSAFTRCSIEFRPGAARFSLYLFCSSTR